MTHSASPDLVFPREPPGELFARYLRFGLLAWGGPVAQIAMIRQELVDEKRWLSREQFNRVLAVYQVLPGPEAHEMCVYFGMRAGGRWGGFLAGLGFMLPGFLLMFALSWMYVAAGASPVILTTVFYGCKPAVLALIVRAIHRIGTHAVTDRWLLMIAVAVAGGSLVGLNFVFLLALAGLAHTIVRRGGLVPGAHALLLAPLGFLGQPATVATGASLLALFASGLRGGLLTFGGAYTVIPFLQGDAVVRGAWMSNAQFLDGLALGGILPAPLIIFSTFVGFLGGGPLGALAMTAGIFLPAFGFTMLAHAQIERLIANSAAHAFLDGVTAGVVGLIAVSALGLARDAVVDLPTGMLFLGALIALYVWKAKAAVVGVMFGAGALGWFLLHFTR